jgi:hypothetical protein
LQRLHGGGERLVTGHLRVRWNSRPLPHALTRLSPFGLPRPDPAAACRVTMTPVGDAERWRRVIGERVVPSRLALKQPGRVLEHAGPTTIELDSWVDEDGRLWQTSRRVSVFGVPVPDLHVTGSERAIDAQRLFCDVRVRSSLWGRLLRYDGILTVHE